MKVKQKDIEDHEKIIFNNSDYKPPKDIWFSTVGYNQVSVVKVFILFSTLEPCTG